MTHGDGGETREDHELAPVIPLFGHRAEDEAPRHGSGHASARPRAVAFREVPDEPSAAGTAASDWDRTWVDDPRTVRAAADRGRPVSASARRSDQDGSSADRPAEDALVKKLRARQLSVVEARRVLRERDVDEVTGDGILDRLERLGYLDDVRLAEQLCHAAVARKGQGRRAVAQSLVARGIARDVVDATIAALPDDDEERALDLARSRAHRVGDDPDAALRRLVGQLTRRGFSSSVAMSAARTALAERR